MVVSAQRRHALEDWMSRLLSDIDISRSVPVAAFLELEAAVRSGVLTLLILAGIVLQIHTSPRLCWSSLVCNSYDALSFWYCETLNDSEGLFSCLFCSCNF